MSGYTQTSANTISSHIFFCKSRLAPGRPALCCFRGSSFGESITGDAPSRRGGTARVAWNSWKNCCVYPLRLRIFSLLRVPPQLVGWVFL